MERIELGTPDLTQENIQKLGELFPQVLTEVQDENGQVQRAVDFDALRDLLGDVAEGTRERYQFTWPGKREAKAEARRPIEKTMRPCPEESVNWDTTENLYIEGDNLDALKILKETYAGKVKMIYIDPPYNTGHDFVYDDDFAVANTEHLEESGQFDERGKLVTNLESNGRFHSDWCSMMYPRLLLARDLLSADGLIAASIDDNEEINLRKICDEVFGAENFVASLPRVTKKGGKSTDFIAKNHDVCLIYSKGSCFKIYPLAHNDPGFCNTDSHFNERGKYKLNQTLDYDTLGYVNSLDYPIVIDGRVYYAGGVSKREYEKRKQTNPKDGYRWRWSKELFEFGFENDFIVVKEGRNGSRIYTKTYQNATIEKVNGCYAIKYAMRTAAMSSLSLTENSFSNDNAKKGIDDLLGKGVFDYTKPVSLLDVLVRTMSSSNDIIVDFFSGSGTCAHAVLNQNARDNALRKFLLVQLPEPTEDNSGAKSSGYANICEIGKERIRRAGDKVRKEVEEANKQLKLGEEPKKVPDIGFRVLKIDSSNFADVMTTPDATSQQMLPSFSDNLKDGRSDMDILFEVLPKFQIPYSAKIEEIAICGKRCFSVDDGYLLACFDKNVGIDTIEAIAKMQPYYAVVRDASMVDDATHANFEELFKTYSPDTVRRVI